MTGSVDGERTGATDGDWRGRVQVRCSRCNCLRSGWRADRERALSLSPNARDMARKMARRVALRGGSRKEKVA